MIFAASVSDKLRYAPVEMANRSNLCRTSEGKARRSYGMRFAGGNLGRAGVNEGAPSDEQHLTCVADSSNKTMSRPPGSSLFVCAGIVAVGGGCHCRGADPDNPNAPSTIPIRYLFIYVVCILVWPSITRASVVVQRSRGAGRRRPRLLFVWRLACCPAAGPSARGSCCDPHWS